MRVKMRCLNDVHTRPMRFTLPQGLKAALCVNVGPFALAIFAVISFAK